MSINNYIGEIGRNPKGATQFAFDLGSALLRDRANQQAQKQAMIQKLIESGQYYPNQGNNPRNISLGGMDFQQQTPQGQAQALQSQIDAYRKMGLIPPAQQGNTPQLGSSQGSAPFQMTPKMDNGRFSMGLTAVDPNKQLTAQKDALEIQKLQGDLANQNKSMGDLSKSPDEIKADMKKSNPGIANLADKVAKGQMSLQDLPRFGTDARFKTQFMEYMASAYPGMNEQALAARRKTMQDYAPGGKVGQNAMIANTAIQHMYELKKVIPQLKDSEFKPWNQLTQTIGRTFGPGSDVLKRYATIKEALAGELQKLYRNGGTSEAETKRIIDNMDMADTPKAQEASLDEASSLIAGRMGQYVDGWNSQFNQPRDPKLPAHILSTRSKYALKQMGLDDAVNAVQNPEGMAGEDMKNEGKSEQIDYKTRYGLD